MHHERQDLAAWSESVTTSGQQLDSQTGSHGFTETEAIGMLNGSEELLQRGLARGDIFVDEDSVRRNRIDMQLLCHDEAALAH